MHVYDAHVHCFGAVHGDVTDVWGASGSHARSASARLGPRFNVKLPRERRGASKSERCAEEAKYLRLARACHALCRINDRGGLGEVGFCSELREGSCSWPARTGRRLIDPVRVRGRGSSWSRRLKLNRGTRARGEHLPDGQSRSSFQPPKG